jgi:hypothetical protein
MNHTLLVRAAARWKVPRDLALAVLARDLRCVYCSRDFAAEMSGPRAGLASWAKAWPDSKDAPPNRNAPPHNNLRLNIDFLLMRTCVSECQRFRLVYVDVYLFTDQFIKLFDCHPPRLRRA